MSIRPMGLSPSSAAGAYLPVKAFTPSDNTSDQKAALNAAMTAAAAAGAKRVQVAHTGNGVCKTTAGLVIPNGITLELAPMVTLQRVVGSTGALIVNNAINAGTGRDTDVGLIGGVGSTIDGGDNSGAANTGGRSGSVGLIHVRIAHADRVTVSGLRFVTTTVGSKYALRLCDVTDFQVSRLGFSCASDGVHITGPAARGKITDLFGTTGDDLVSLCASEGSYNYMEPAGTGFGDITDVEVRSLFSNGCPRLVNFFGTAGEGKIRRVTVDGVHGTTTGAVFSMLGDTGGALDISDIRLRNLDARATASTPFAYIGATSANVTAGLITVESVNYSCSVSPNAALTVAAGSTVEQYTVRGWGNTDPHTVGNTALVAVSGTVTTLKLEDIRHKMGVTAAQLVNAPGTVGRLFMSHINADETTTLFTNFGSSNATVTTIFLSDSYIKSSNTGRLIDSRIAAGVDLYMTNVHADVSFALVYANGGPVNIRGAAGVRDVQGGGLNRAASEVVHSLTPAFPCDVNSLAKTTGDQAYNTNGARACGVGPVFYTGTAWQNLATAATF